MCMCQQKPPKVVLLKFTESPSVGSAQEFSQPGADNRMRPNRQAVFVEIFAGCAKLSKCMNEAGFQSIPVDSAYNEHSPLVPILVLDLTDSSAQGCLMDLLVGLSSSGSYPHRTPVWHGKSCKRKANPRSVKKARGTATPASQGQR